MAPMIIARELYREFRTPKRYPGFLGSIRTLFTRQYNVVRAVDHVSFSIERGELVGYIGPNGAGKSTTIKMLTGVLVPTSGYVETRGLVPHKHRQKLARHIGAVFGQRSQLWWDLPLAESFRILKEVYRVPDETYERNMRAFNELVGLDELLNTPVRHLSLGQRMRGEMVAALLHDPEIVFLDEPLIGLDVVASRLLELHWTPPALAFLLLVMAGGCLIELSLFLLFNTLVFWTIEAGRLAWLIVGTFSDNFALYPLNIYNSALQFVMTFLVPVGFMSYYPATAFLNRTGDTPFSPAFAYLTPLVGMGLFALAYSFWRVGINRYQSTGS